METFHEHSHFSKPNGAFEEELAQEWSLSDTFLTLGLVRQPERLINQSKNRLKNEEIRQIKVS